MIVLTGAAGFIGSCLLTVLQEESVVIVDDFSREDRVANYESKHYHTLLERTELDAWLSKHGDAVTAIYHLGARTDTTEFDKQIFEDLNIEYSKMVWRHCVKHQIPLVYASSAATYGGGEHGYEDSHAIVDQLEPLNPYGDSKLEFDKWALAQQETPPRWYGLKFFNVYGPNEYHKGRMASVIFHAYNQISKTGSMRLFKSHRSDFKDGEQSRDFVYVKDVVNVCKWLMESTAESGLYNLGTGQARTFYDLVLATFTAMQVEPSITFIDTPEDIRDKYQYFTEANMSKLQRAGYAQDFTSLEDGVANYVKTYLSSAEYY